jgi:uncharacterized protein involved in exopolysaccharide biosynthesis
MKLLPTVVLVLAGLLAGTAVWADTKTPSVQVSADKIDPQVQSLKKQLSLTEQQTKKLNEIFQDTNTQRKALYAQRAALQKQMFELHDKNLERVNGVLTTDQAKKYEQIRSEPPPEVMEAQPSIVPQPPQSTE